MTTQEQIITLANQLGEALADSQAYQDLQAAEAALNLDGQAQDMLQQTDFLRSQLRSQLEGGTPPEQLQEGLKELREANAALSAHPTLSAAQEARTAFQNLLSQVDTLLRYHTGRGGEECGGSCGSCGGCG